MFWFKASSNIHDHPTVLMPLEMDERAAELGLTPTMLANAVLGFVLRCAALAAQNQRDGIVLRGEALYAAMSVGERYLIDIATECGYWTPITTAEGKQGYQLAKQNGVFSMVSREDRAWEAQRTSDRNDPRLSTNIRLRDGDQCRWCGQIVVWLDRKSPRGGTYDHLIPGKAATVDTYVVACRRCNSTRNDERNGWEVKLRPEPAHPVYGLATVEFLARHGIYVDETPRPRP